MAWVTARKDGMHADYIADEAKGSILSGCFGEIYLSRALLARDLS